MTQAEANALIEAGFHVVMATGTAPYFYLPIGDDVEVCIEPTTEPGMFELAVYRYQNLIHQRKLHITVLAACRSGDAPVSIMPRYGHGHQPEEPLKTEPPTGGSGVPAK